MACRLTGVDVNASIAVLPKYSLVQVDAALGRIPNIGGYFEIVDRHQPKILHGNFGRNYHLMPSTT